MYICKKAEGKTTKQLELGDFFGKSRQIIFDMADPKDLKKANRVLKPKGVKPKKKRSSKSQKTPKIQKDLKAAVPKGTPKKSKTTKKKDILSQSQFAEKKEGVPISLKKEKKSTKRNMNTVLTTSAELQISKNEISTIDPAINSSALPKSDKKIKKEITSNSETEKLPIIKTLDVEEKNIQKLPVISETEPLIDVKPTVSIKQPKIMGWEQVLPSFLAESVGDGGQLEVECPICHNQLAFQYDDLDMKNIKNTRLCDCGALVRISIRKSPAMVFLDLKLQKEALAVLLKGIENEVVDEYNNPIFSYALKNE